MSIYDSIIVGEEWISEHYLTTDARTGSFNKQVIDLRTEWDAAEQLGKTTPRSQLAAEAREIAQATTELGTGDDAPERDEVITLHAHIRGALGYLAAPAAWSSMRGGSELTLPSATVMPSPSGTALLILDALAAQTVEDILDPDGAGQLFYSALIDGKPERATSRVISAVFLSDDAPPYVLVQAGRWVLLAERVRWPEGRWLAIDIGVVAERRDVRKAGELDHAVASLGRDSLLPRADGTVLWDAILADSVQHTVGVSKSLREGIRLSVEIIANEVVRRRRAAELEIEGVPDLAIDLTRESLRFLYRILFLLYAESAPELGVLPVQAPEYQAGYGVDRLRDLTLVELTSDRARSGTHLFESLATLFRLVDRGHTPAGRSADDDHDAGDLGESLRFHPLRADLFAADATNLIDQVKLSNAAVQQVLAHLLLSKERRGTDRGFISYAELGINELGAVYEGLMSYTGSFAEDDLFEVAPNGDPEKGTWVLPASRVHDVSAEDFVRTTDELTGEPIPVLHRRGTFVYRLAGRERQQSASYYTPEVLTRSVVSHSLAELLDQDGAPTAAADILRLTVCEPALGSGAFAIEAVRQLADEYLKRRQRELGETIAAEQIPAERQKVKAYLALHQVYGVDLNATAVELAEVSLWLDTMAKDLQAPWFGLHLRRGDSLIGARRAVYSPAVHLKSKAWLSTAPEDVAMSSETPIAGRVHHFLLPAQGWGAAADTAEARTYAPDARERLRLWRTEIRRNPSATDIKRLASLGRRVETLWQLASRRMVIAEREIRRHIDVWGADDLVESTGAVEREDIERVLRDQEGAYLRLRRVMDAWCALWFWPLTDRFGEDAERILPPTWEQWLGALEALLGQEGNTKAGGKRAPGEGQRGFDDHSTWDDLDQAELLDRGFHDVRKIDEAIAQYPWLQVSEQVAVDQGFFHWELDFAAAFERGGFSLQLGNPPWVRPQWDEASSLAESDPWWKLTSAPPAEDEQKRREQLFGLPGHLDAFLDERASVAGVIEYLSSPIVWPALAAGTANLYRTFIVHTWRVSTNGGVVGLVHPDACFTDSSNKELRRMAYVRLRRHWQFVNQLKFFEIGNTRPFGISIYGSPQSQPNFLHAASLYHPSVVDKSLRHDGTGEVPGLKDSAGDWDLRPHKKRLIPVDATTLASWSDLLDDPGTPYAVARMLYPVNQSSASVLEKLAHAPRFGRYLAYETPGWNQTSAPRRGLIVQRTARPATIQDAILQGPHISVLNSLFQEAKTISRSHRDYIPIDLEKIGADFIPRTNFQRNVSQGEYLAAYPHWEDRPSLEHFRLAWRRRADNQTVRTLQAAILPPGPAHLHQVHTLCTSTLTDLLLAAGFWSSLIVDFYVKLAGFDEVVGSVVSRFPHVREHPLQPELLLRTARLSVLGSDYAPLWSDLFHSAWQQDRWTGEELGPSQRDLGRIAPEWTRDTALRLDIDRRRALVEIDSLVAVMLGITADELITVFRSQFPVLQGYERNALYDANGRQVPSEIAKACRLHGHKLTVAERTANGQTYALPFTGVDREHEMRVAVDHFVSLTEARRPRAAPEEGRR